jgi:hypothetical protein
MHSRTLAREWTVDGYMNMAPGCGGSECNPHMFPVQMEDGSQRTVCLDHMPEAEFALACAIVAGLEPPIPMDQPLREIDRTFSFLPMPVREVVLEHTCRSIRERSVRA